MRDDSKRIKSYKKRINNLKQLEEGKYTLENGHTKMRTGMPVLTALAAAYGGLEEWCFIFGDPQLDGRRQECRSR
jgi:hypothetical protein